LVVILQHVHLCGPLYHLAISPCNVSFTPTYKAFHCHIRPYYPVPLPPPSAPRSGDQGWSAPSLSEKRELLQSIKRCQAGHASRKDKDIEQNRTEIVQQYINGKRSVVRQRTRPTADITEWTLDRTKDYWVCAKTYTNGMMFCLPRALLEDDDDSVMKRPHSRKKSAKQTCLRCMAGTGRPYTRTLQIDRVATNSLSIWCGNCTHARPSRFISSPHEHHSFFRSFAAGDTDGSVSGRHNNYLLLKAPLFLSILSGRPSVCPSRGRTRLSNQAAGLVSWEWVSGQWSEADAGDEGDASGVCECSRPTDFSTCSEGSCAKLHANLADSIISPPTVSESVSKYRASNVLLYIYRVVQKKIALCNRLQ